MQEKITGVGNVEILPFQEPLVDIENAEHKKTRVLLGEILLALNAGKRIRFFTSAGKGASTAQCLRVMLSRTRNALEAKGRKRRHFKLHAHVCNWTGLGGFRKDCVTMWRSTNQTHSVLETLEDLMDREQAA